ncbi:MAG TPA: cell wall-binding repeat-containing protein, partial [Acidimicrobiales bacterium]|nr:cell wall-binding repeat-containing protein [Acidimicrobiales bacterium]
MASALTVFGLAFAPSAGAVDDVDRLAGATRYGTAAAISAEGAFDGATTAILATGENFPDALAASGLASANAPAPILLTTTAELSSEALAALDELGVANVTVVGGTAAVSSSVIDTLEDEGYAVNRVAGVNRYETAAAIANESGAANDFNGLATAVIATGQNFPDALTGGVISYVGGFPLLLTDSGVPAATESALNGLGIEQVIILGGTAAVSPAVESELESITGNDAIRLAGVNRFGTAVEVAEFGIDEAFIDVSTVLLAAGFNFPDALAGGPLGGELTAPILLMGSLPQETEDFLVEHGSEITRLIALGGTAAISEADLNAAVEAAESGDDTTTQATATTRPELVTASIVETRTAAASTASRPPGTYVLYCFDEPITGAPITATLFHLYNSDGTRFTGTPTEAGGGQSFTSGVTSTDNKCAEVIFGGPTSGGGLLDTAAEAANLTLATVARGAATGQAGAAGDTNIEGDAPLTPASTAPAAAGVTSAPDLVSVGNFRAGSTADLTAVDFTFDQAAFVQVTNGFHIVDNTGATFLCIGSAAAVPSGQAAPGGSGTATLTVACEEPAGFPGNFAAANFARGYVDAGAVSATSTPSGFNPLQAANVTGGTNGVTSRPDLTGIIFAPDAILNADVVAYLYDEAVQAGVTQGRHAIYNTAGTENLAAACSRSSDNNTIVTCAFADNTLSGANFVGGSVRAGGVLAADDGAANAADEEGASPSAGPTATTGRTDGPDLLSVTINRGTNIFGNPTATATFTFDEDTANTASALLATDAAAGGNDSTGENVILGLLHLYLADGIRLDCTSLSGGLGTAQDSSVLANRSE